MSYLGNGQVGGTGRNVSPLARNGTTLFSSLGTLQAIRETANLTTAHCIEQTFAIQKHLCGHYLPFLLLLKCSKWDEKGCILLVA